MGLRFSINASGTPADTIFASL
uniref:Uncharacterized protein n=1 Tax=Romanomermis culicivorax TaxID=13658 RepID=A0A915KZR4_ROMCU